MHPAVDFTGEGCKVAGGHGKILTSHMEIVIKEEKEKRAGGEKKKKKKREDSLFKFIFGGPGSHQKYINTSGL